MGRGEGKNQHAIQCVAERPGKNQTATRTTRFVTCGKLTDIHQQIALVTNDPGIGKLVAQYLATP